MSVPMNELPECPIFDAVGSEALSELLARMRLETYVAGQEILREGQECQYLWIIKSGECEVVKSLSDGSTRTLANLESGAIFGEMSYLQPAENSATVRSVTEVKVWRLPPEEFQELEQTAPHVALRIVKAIAEVVSERLRKMDEWISQSLVSENGGRHQEWSEFRDKLYSNWEF